MKRFRIYAFAAAAATVGAIGTICARGEMRLIDPEYDFGIMRELDGEQTGYAHLVNDGPDTTYIRSVRPSCGCTGAFFYSDPVAPGDTTVVSFTYNPAGRPGNFTKTVKVYVGDSDERHIIRLHGRVVGSPQTLSRNYPIECGRLRLSERLVELRDVKPSTGRHAFIRMVNQSMDTVTPQWQSDSKDLSLDVTPTRLAPGEMATFGIFLNSGADAGGSVEYVIPFKADADSAYTDIVIRANILPRDSVARAE